MFKRRNLATTASALVLCALQIPHRDILAFRFNPHFIVRRRRWCGDTCPRMLPHAERFPSILPPDRLGRQHSSLQSYREAVYGPVGILHVPPQPLPGRKHYSLVIVTSTQSSSRRRILLGRKHRGFGKGLISSFGGKVDPADASPAAAAVRELHEEANISVDIDTMKSGAVGTIHFTFDEEEDFEMIVHLFRIDLRGHGEEGIGDDESKVVTRSNLSAASADFSVIRGCEEITPQWFDDWRSIPLNKMFADDSIWLPLLLESEGHMQFDGYFHFRANPQVTNTVLEYFIDVKN
jgi:8-oxo-dGTP pyrophosphatase MutT (NUDIX family)